MIRPLRDPQSSILTARLVFRIGMVGTLLLMGLFGLFQWELLQVQSLEVARTAAVNMFVFGEVFYLFNCRSLEFSMWHVGFFSNRWLLIGVTLMIGLQLLFTYWSWMNQTFRSAPLALTEWGLIIYNVVGFEKTLRSWISRKAKDSSYANLTSG